MIRSVLSALLVFCGYWAQGQLQRFGNEWINYDARYWAFTVTAEGLYRLDSAHLADAGFPLSTIDARTIQIFGREKEVPLYFPGDSDGVMNATDLIEFYAKNNDAWMDTMLWDSPEHMNNPNYSMISDSLEFFITWNATAQPQRVKGQSAAGYTVFNDYRPWFWSKAFYQGGLAYKRGTRELSTGAYTSFLGEGEGYMAPDWVQNGTLGPVDLNVLTPNPYQGADADSARMTVVVASNNAPGGPSCSSLPDHRLVLSVGSQLDTVANLSWSAYKLFKLKTALSTFQMGPTSLVRFSQPRDLVGTCANLVADYPDRLALSYVETVYPHAFNFLGETSPQHMWIPNDVNNSPAHIRLASFFEPAILYAYGDTVRRMLPILEANGYNAWIPADAANDSTYVLAYPSSQVRTANVFRPVNGSGSFTDFAANEVDSALVIVTHPKLWVGANVYAEYRSGISPNRYNTLVANVEELYQQYSGGVAKHPVAIRRFMGHLLDAFETKPQALFLIGKSVQAADLGNGEQSGYRSEGIGDTLARKNCLVPSFGYPPSDGLLTLGLSGQPWDLTVPVGRLAAIDNDDVINYKNKLAQFEGQPVAAWMKNILHFRGGLSASDFSLFEYYLSQYTPIVEDTCFSGRVTTFRKTLDDNDQIVFAATDSVYDMVAEGVTLMTFMAHAYGAGFDFSLDAPSSYQWNGRYPMIIGNSCYTGNINLAPGTSSSEQFVLPANSGAIAFLASTDLGVTGALYPSTTAFYRSFSQARYGQSIGRHIQYMDSTVLFNIGEDILNQAGIHQFTLHGDPTVVLNSPREPDFEIREQDVRFLPEPVTVDADTFKLVVTIRNIGKGTNASFPVAVRRRLVEENITMETAALQTHSMASWQDTLTFLLPVLQDSGGAGFNQIEVRVDLDPYTVDELENDTNNTAMVDLLITSGDLLPVDPYNFAITPDLAPLLQASTGDPFAPLRTYVFQIDTIDTYDSPRFEQGVVTAPGGVVSWLPPTIYTLNSAEDSLVYFWRCSVDSTGNGGYDWKEFSFQCIPGRSGWGQAHHMQFKPGVFNNSFTTLQHDRPGVDFDFDQGLHSISAQTLNQNTGVPQWRMDLLTQEGGGCGSLSALHLAVVDPLDFLPWTTYWNGTGHYLGADNDQGPPGDNPDCTISYRPMKVFQFKQNGDVGDGLLQLPALENALRDSIPDGHYILLYTYKFLNRDAIESVAPGLISALGDLGATNLANGTVPDTCGYIFFCQKGNNTYTQEVWSQGTTAPDDVISITALLPSSGRAGSMSAPRTGDALEWNSLHWEIDPNLPTDSATINVNTVSVDDVEQFAHAVVPAATTDSLLLSDIGISALANPRLRLSGYYRSETGAAPKPAQTKRWQIVASPAAECAIDPPFGFYSSIDSLFEGETARVMVAVRNISNVPMDSMLMAAWVVNAQNERTLVHYYHRAPLPVDGVLLDTISFPLDHLAGYNTLIIEANPLDTLTGYYDQREQFHFNNIAVLRFETMRDKQNPVLDVTFDGIHILDGDIVSARPEVVMSLDDENLALIMDALEDTVNIKVYLRRPNASTEEWLRFAGPSQVLEFVPATAPDNVCHIKYNPVLVQDGVYSLRVHATDISRNVSGSEDYSVSFEVVNKPTITEVLNYPNPFTTSTRFVFTLTGHEIPTGMRIRIMTIGGRVVREIGLDEIGQLHIGRNVSEYAWDGKDEFGDKLARGVYLYQVVAQLHGTDIEYRETSASGFFTKGFGKMYLLR
ncbi:MAG: hypothetical protein IPO90_06335 [Flavobacteriales bacterium]|nr:hypothetical protein [Flavobacteriales bacterium]